MPILQKVVAFFLHCLLTNFSLSAFSVLEDLALNYVCATDPRCFVNACTFASGDKWGKGNDPFFYVICQKSCFGPQKKKRHSTFTNLSVCIMLEAEHVALYSGVVRLDSLRTDIMET